MFKQKHKHRFDTNKTLFCKIFVVAYVLVIIFKVFQARMDLSTLEQHVANTFGQIPTNKLPSDDFSDYAFKPDSVTEEFRSIYYVKPVGDTTEVRLTV